jgi:hypothetical protein
VRFYPPATELGPVLVDVFLDGGPALPALAGLAQVEADGRAVAGGAPSVIDASTGGAGFRLEGGATNIRPLADAGALTLRLRFADGGTATLRLTGPGDPEDFATFLLYPSRVLVWNGDSGTGTMG